MKYQWNHLVLFAQQAGLLRGQWLSPLQAQLTSPGPYKHMWMSVWGQPTPEELKLNGPPYWQCRGVEHGGNRPTQHHFSETPRLANTKQKYVLKRPYPSPTTVFPAAAECMSAKGGPLGLASVPPDIKLFLTLPSLTTLLKLQSQCSHYGLIFLLVDLKKQQRSCSVCGRGKDMIPPHSIALLIVLCPG